MSSLGAAQADGYYYPPEYDGRKHGSLNNFRGSHALGKRAAKLKTEGVLVIRFEMPYHVSCAGCGKRIGKGVRFNAEKRHVGNYYTTKVWSFTMRAPCCQQVIEVRTDPKNAEYVVVSGAARTLQSLEEDADASAGARRGLVEEEVGGSGAGASDAFERLEKSQRQKVAATSANKQIRDLHRWNAATTRDNYQMNRQLRAANRSKRKEEQALAQEGRALGLSAGIRLLRETPEDGQRAAIAFLERQMAGPGSAMASRGALAGPSKRRQIRRESIFAGATPAAAGKPLRPLASRKGKAPRKSSSKQVAAKLARLASGRSPLASSSRSSSKR